MKVPRISPCDRAGFILERIRGKKVLHIGCADWPWTENKVKNGALLHQKMVGVASKLVGLDLAREGVAIMQEAGIENLYVANVEMSAYDYLQDKFDVVVVAEVLEHILNAGNVLESIKTVCHKKTVLL
ncbi:MAG: methyltransferase domain-containing protein [Deltaproteobacteria bacterium]|nr:methyltransferase domain-containing protein [Deltaproteobacteria bacterium]MBW2074709.1 methyltransferase domain-containing protein [Deltaproteobacteria bacterium]